MTATVPALLQPMKDRLAAATPGPWIVDRQTHDIGGYGPWEYIHIPEVTELDWESDGSDAHMCGADFKAPDAEFIANAPTDQAKLIAAIEDVAVQHVPVVIYEIDPVNGAWVYEGDERKVLTKLCQACTPASILDDIDEGEYDGGGSDHDVHYPCPTVAALTQALGGDTA